jgi:tetratricopeptide (TPR) repeat protein
LTKSNPPDSEFWTKKGIALGNQGEYGEAIKCFDEALKINPNYADAWYAKGIASYAQKNYEAAIKFFDRAIELNPHDLMAYDRKNRSLKALGRNEEAEAVLAKAKELGYTG